MKTWILTKKICVFQREENYPSNCYNNSIHRSLQNIKINFPDSNYAIMVY